MTARTMRSRVLLAGRSQDAAEERPPPARREVGSRSTRNVPLILGAPYVLLYVVFFILPFLYSIIESTRSELTGGYTGTRNYVTVFHSAAFWGSMSRMAYFTVLQVGIMLSLALLLALLLDTPFCRARRLFALVYFLPYAVPGVIAAIMWAFMLSPNTDSLLAHLHIDLLSNGAILYVIMAIVTWAWTGYNMTLYLAGLTAVPPELVDAARVDGCGEFKIAWRIKLPFLRRILFFTVTASLIGTFQLFNEPAVISTFHPLGAGYTPNLLIYTTAFFFGDIPLAAAESMVLAAITISGAALAMFVIRQQARTRNRGG